MARTDDPAHDDDEEEEVNPEPYPGTVVSIIDQVAGIVLGFAALGGVASIIVALASNDLADDEKVLSGLIGVGVIIVGAVQWAFMRAVSLGLVYLWRIHIDLWAQED
jgi:hypothetical protein